MMYSQSLVSRTFYYLRPISCQSQLAGALNGYLILLEIFKNGCLTTTKLLKLSYCCHGQKLLNDNSLVKHVQETLLTMCRVTALTNKTESPVIQVVSFFHCCVF